MTTPLTTPEDYLALLREATGLDLDEASVHRDFDALAGWDSLHLLKLVSSLERATGRRVPVGQVLQARTLDEIRAIATAA
ncbi:acyl carrier protein [Streptacidiphilus jiangxiensis]|uniref:Acyl carrier protein n=1 Tax=Streptacidiphilus jiangxiensis TaxID=235985 RepID=A0A1H7IDW2_STRJI|nr:acyl carrier protein [Streptacidiphilus jiangxiensis]SEK58815.1 Acyl carrier protein [Streptacidiphilus jiangxiensis]